MNYKIRHEAPYGRCRALAGGFIALALVGALYALLTGTSGQPPQAPRPAPALIPCPAQVAAALGTHWDPNEGATEMLEEFAFGVTSCERERGEWVCWNEENLESPTGLERICGQPSHLNEALARGTHIWEVFLHPTFPSCTEGQPCWDCRHMGDLSCGGDGYASSGSIPTALPAIPHPAPLSL